MIILYVQNTFLKKAQPPSIFTLLLNIGIVRAFPTMQVSPTNPKDFSPKPY